jgi:hypothetical protein
MSTRANWELRDSHRLCSFIFGGHRLWRRDVQSKGLETRFPAKTRPKLINFCASRVWSLDLRGEVARPSQESRWVLLRIPALLPNCQSTFKATSRLTPSQLTAHMGELSFYIPLSWRVPFLLEGRTVFFTALFEAYLTSRTKKSVNYIEFLIDTTWYLATTLNVG